MKEVFMRQLRLVVVLGLIAGLLSACGVSKSQYTKLQDEKRELEQRAGKLSRQLGELQRANQTLSQDNIDLQDENRRLRESPKTQQGSEAESYDESYLK